MPRSSRPSALPGFRYSPLGLRDGILAQMLAQQDARAKAHREFEHERWESVLGTARRYGVDPRQCRASSRACSSAFSRTQDPARTWPPEYESWLAAAAVLRDTGKFINHQGHHRHAQYIISSSEIYGYTQLQRTLVSAIARYLGKSRPQPGDRALRNIPTEEHKNVHRAVVLLRLAVALNQDRASDVLRVATGSTRSAFIWSCTRGAQARNWSCGRCAKRQATSARSSAESFSSRWRKWPAPMRGSMTHCRRGGWLSAIEPGDGAFAHADRRAAVAGNQAAQKLEQIRIMPYRQNSLAV